MFVGSFFIAEAMKVHGLGARAAATTVAMARGPTSLLVAPRGARFVLPPMMSTAAPTAIVLPIALAATVNADRRYQAAIIATAAHNPPAP